MLLKKRHFKNGKKHIELELARVMLSAIKLGHVNVAWVFLKRVPRQNCHMVLPSILHTEMRELSKISGCQEMELMIEYSERRMRRYVILFQGCFARFGENSRIF